MRKTALTIALAGALALPAAAGAQSVDIHIDLPQILPPLVVIQPGVQVVPEVDHEVFYVDGVYWARHDGGWYRAAEPRGAWVGVPVPGVPMALVKIPPGKYKKWKPAKAKKGAPAAYLQGDDQGGHGKKAKKHGKH